MVANILDRVCTKGIVQGDRDEVIKVATHLCDTPLGSSLSPNTKCPSGQLRAAKNMFVQVHDAATECVDTLVDLGKCLPGIAAIGLSNAVKRAVTEKVAFGVFAQR